MVKLKKMDDIFFFDEKKMDDITHAWLDTIESIESLLYDISV